MVNHKPYCNTFWGSHGCDISVESYHTIHQCGVPEEECCQFDSLTGLVRFSTEEGWDAWHTYGDGRSFSLD